MYFYKTSPKSSSLSTLLMSFIHFSVVYLTKGSVLIHNTALRLFDLTIDGFLVNTEINTDALHPSCCLRKTL